MQPAKAFDCVILGGGPAGLSAAHYTLRAGLSTMIWARDSGALAKAHLVENYFGFAEPVSGASIVEAGRANVRRLGGEFMESEVISLSMAEDGLFSISDGAQSVTAKTVLLATGRGFQAAPYKLDRFIGNGVSRCAICDGFFFRGKPVAVLGNGKYALTEAEELLPLASSVTLLTNGKEPSFEERPEGLIINTAPLSGPTSEHNAITGTERLTGMVDKNGHIIPVSGLFLALGTPGAADFASRLGVMTEHGHILVDADGMTNVPGIFAAGDCTGTPYQVSVAVGQGATAGMAIVEHLRAKNKLY
jgi:thioredoxin reductase (NADPH)